MSYLQRIERYWLLLKSPACTAYYRQWIINRMCELHLAYANSQGR